MKNGLNDYDILANRLTIYTKELATRGEITSEQEEWVQVALEDGLERLREGEVEREQEERASIDHADAHAGNGWPKGWYPGTD